MTTQKAIEPSTVTRFALAAALLAAAALTGCNADADTGSSGPFRPALASSFNGEAISNLSAGYSTPVVSRHASRPHGSYMPSQHHAL